jgi:ParB-like chromosome segregation protein Spo0J
MRVQRVEEVALERLRFGLSPRQVFCDDQHVAALAEVLDEVPPIVVHAGTLQVIDGVHRVHAAKRVGRRTIRALIFDGDEIEARIEAVRSNITHGKPLTLREREAAALRVLALVPAWSDRRIAMVSGLSPKTVARLRARATVDSPQSRARLGRDGRLRPVDPAAVRRRVAEALRADPGASNRAIAKRAGASQATVRDVRERLSQGLNELAALSSRRRQRKAAKAAKSAKAADTTPAAGAAGAAGPAAAPAATGPTSAPTGPQPVAAAAARRTEGVPSDFATWFEIRHIDDGHWQRFVDVVPIGRVYEIADACRRFSASWKAFAVALEDRARGHRGNKAG